VGVISSRDDLRWATRTRVWPDLFELRLDALVAVADEVELAVPRLRAPLIITARDPREGGVGKLTAITRRQLLRRFLRYARYIDIELRNAAQFADIIMAARRAGAGLIFSFHDFRGTPGLESLRDKLHRAREADILKIATTVSTAAEVERLVRFFEEAKGRPLAAMGMGPLGRESRIQLARAGSALNYAERRPGAELGQLGLRDLRRLLRSG
jgi:3-dehydroquinate dehydratase-1